MSKASTSGSNTGAKARGSNAGASAEARGSKTAAKARGSNNAANARGSNNAANARGSKTGAAAKAREPDAEPPEDDEELAEPRLPKGTKNYITPAGYRRLKDELKELAVTVRPEVARVVSWAAENGDRSENGDYIYGKKRLREIDRRMRFLTKRLRAAEVVDPTERDIPGVFFGATVTVEDEEGEQRTYAIVGVDEIDLERGRISWISPMARALMKRREGDVVTLRTPGGLREIEILDVEYKPLE